MLVSPEQFGPIWRPLYAPLQHTGNTNYTQTSRFYCQQKICRKSLLTQPANVSVRAEICQLIIHFIFSLNAKWPFATRHTPEAQSVPHQVNMDFQFMSYVHIFIYLHTYSQIKMHVNLFVYTAFSDIFLFVYVCVFMLIALTKL